MHNILYQQVILEHHSFIFFFPNCASVFILRGRIAENAVPIVQQREPSHHSFIFYLIIIVLLFSIWTTEKFSVRMQWHMCSTENPLIILLSFSPSPCSASVFNVRGRIAEKFSVRMQWHMCSSANQQTLQSFNQTFKERRFLEMCSAPLWWHLFCIFVILKSFCWLKPIQLLWMVGKSRFVM